MSNLPAEPEPEPEAFDPLEGKLQAIVCATADAADWPLDHTITDLLRLVREHFGMDIEGFSHPRAESFASA